MTHSIKYKTYINLFFFNFFFCLQVNQGFNSAYNDAISARKDGRTDEALMRLHKIENLHLESNYLIAEIYLNEVKNPNIALDYYKIVLSKTINFAEDNNEINKNLYRKSLFMVSYIYSNYLGMYSEAVKSYNMFLEKFTDDELSESVNYELELLKPFELEKKQIIGNKNG